MFFKEVNTGLEQQNQVPEGTSVFGFDVIDLAVELDWLSSKGQAEIEHFFEY